MFSSIIATRQQPVGEVLEANAGQRVTIVERLEESVWFDERVRDLEIRGNRSRGHGGGGCRVGFVARYGE